MIVRAQMSQYVDDRTGGHQMTVGTGWTGYGCLSESADDESVPFRSRRSFYCSIVRSSITAPSDGAPKRHRRTAVLGRSEKKPPIVLPSAIPSGV